MSSTPAQGQRVMAVILVTDGVGCNARMADDPEHTTSLVRRDLQLMQDLCLRFDGQVIKPFGNDGLVMYFVNTVQAVSCAIEIQKALTFRASNLSDEEVLTHRIGIHLGDVVFGDNDVVGNGVNVAIRVQEEAAPRGICMSQTVYDAVRIRLSLEATFLGSLKLKNVEDAVQVYQILPAIHFSSGGEEMQTVAEAQLAVGTLINNRYQIEKVLGHGGFGRTYLASDTHCFGDYCVLKEFVPASRTEYVVQKSRQLFEREARVLYELNHPQIPRFLAWLTDRGRLFLVQEYIDGQTYADIIQARALRQQTPFSEAEVIQWLRDLLPVLSYLHQRNILHRDISPENIMLPHGLTQPVLIDFGLVKQTVSQILATHANSTVYTSQPSVVGKFGYSPPEQIRMGQCYPCSDLYALGVTAIVMLTGRDLGVLMDHQSLEWQWHSYVQISDYLRQMLDRMLAEKPRERYQSAEEVLADLRWFGANGNIIDQPILDIRIEIDEEKRQRQVNEIVEADYFRELMQEVEGLRDDFFESEEHSSQVEPDREIYAASQITQPPPLSDISDITVASPAPEPQTFAVEPLPASTPDSPNPSELNPAFLETCRQELARFIGPMAGLILNNVISAKREISKQSLIEALAERIPDAQQAKTFRAAVSQPDQPRSGTEGSKPSPTVISSPATAKPATISQSQSAANLSPDFLNACKQELTRCIGPIANLVLQQSIAQHPGITVQQLVEVLATQIPNPQQANEFKQNLARFTR